MQQTLEFPASRNSDPQTSRDAAKAAKQRQDGIAADVHALLAAHPEGLSDFELCDLLPQHVPGSVIKRRGELEKAGRVADSGKRRVNRNHRRVIVWTVR